MLTRVHRVVTADPHAKHSSSRARVDSSAVDLARSFSFFSAHKYVTLINQHYRETPTAIDTADMTPTTLLPTSSPRHARVLRAQPTREDLRKIGYLSLVTGTRSRVFVTVSGRRPICGRQGTSWFHPRDSSADGYVSCGGHNGCCCCCRSSHTAVCSLLLYEQR